MSSQQDSNNSTKMSTRSATFLGIGAMLGAGIVISLMPTAAGGRAGDEGWFEYFYERRT